MTRILKERELDALTEMAHVGMGHAATALSQLMNQPVAIRVPRLQMLADPGESLRPQQVQLLHLQILGNVRGTLLILLRDEEARHMLELLIGESPAAGAALSELASSTLLEVGNILASACLNALGSLLKMTLLPSVPGLLTGEAGALLGRFLDPAQENGEAVVVDTVFSVAGSRCGGSLFLIPAPGSLAVMLQALGER